MICLDVELRGERYRVGTEGGVVTAFVNLITLPGMPPYNPQIPETSPVQLAITGFDAEQRAIHWGTITMPVAVGDVVQIRVVEAAEADAPTLTPMLPPLPEDDGEE